MQKAMPRITAITIPDIAPSHTAVSNKQTIHATVAFLVSLSHAGVR